MTCDTGVESLAVDHQGFPHALIGVFLLCVLYQLWTDIEDKNISCFTSDLKESINEEVRAPRARTTPSFELPSANVQLLMPVLN